MKTIPPGHEAVMAAIAAAASTCHLELPGRRTELPVPPASEYVKAPVKGFPAARDADAPVMRCEAVFS